MTLTDVTAPAWAGVEGVLLDADDTLYDTRSAMHRAGAQAAATLWPDADPERAARAVVPGSIAAIDELPHESAGQIIVLSPVSEEPGARRAADAVARELQAGLHGFTFSVGYSRVAFDPAGAHAVGMQREARPRAGPDHDHVEEAVPRVGLDAGATAERAGARDGHLPRAAGEQLGAVAAHLAPERLGGQAGAQGPDRVGERSQHPLEPVRLARRGR